MLVTMRGNLSVSALVAGFVAVLVGFTSSVVIVFQAAAAFGATPAQTASWIWALGLGMGLTSLGLSLRYRQPVLTAWSTPGAALLATAGVGFPMAEGVGAFMLCAALITLAGITGWFERVMNRIPVSLASALLAGVLARFAFDGFAALQREKLLVGAMLLAYLLGRRWWPRYAVPGVLGAGVAVAAWQGQLHAGAVHWQLAMPEFTMPRFSLAAAIGIALPLFVVTMASQNLPGVAAQRAAGYHTPVSPVITTTGLATLVLAVAGLALLDTIGSGLAAAMKDEGQREAALVTFVVTASGLTLWGVGAAFWGVVAGALVLGVQRLGR